MIIYYVINIHLKKNFSHNQVSKQLLYVYYSKIFTIIMIIMMMMMMMIIIIIATFCVAIALVKWNIHTYFVWTGNPSKHVEWKKTLNTVICFKNKFPIPLLINSNLSHTDTDEPGMSLHNLDCVETTLTQGAVT